jgi:hypothetical protein
LVFGDASAADTGAEATSPAAAAAGAHPAAAAAAKAAAKVTQAQAKIDYRGATRTGEAGAAAAAVGAESSGASSACEDSDWKCAAWALSGECEADAEFMASKCRRSCGLCGGGGSAAGGGSRSQQADEKLQQLCVGRCDASCILIAYMIVNPAHAFGQRAALRKESPPAAVAWCAGTPRRQPSCRAVGPAAAWARTAWPPWEQGLLPPPPPAAGWRWRRGARALRRGAHGGRCRWRR